MLLKRTELIKLNIMEKELNTDWVLNLPNMWPISESYCDVIYQKEMQTAEYVKKESHDTLYLDIHSVCIVQKKTFTMELYI